MSEVIDLSDARNRREMPDEQFRQKDDFGRPMFTYLLSYDMEGAQYSMSVVAYSMDDAANRVDAMRASLRLDGQVFSDGRA